MRASGNRRPFSCAARSRALPHPRDQHQRRVALVAIGRDIHASIPAATTLKLPGIGTIRVKAANISHHRIPSRLGTDRVILPEQPMGRHLVQMHNTEVVQDYVSGTDDKAILPGKRADLRRFGNALWARRGARTTLRVRHPEGRVDPG